MVDMGVREGIWALVAVLVLYLVVILFRLALPRRAVSVGEGSASPQTVVMDAPPPREPSPAPAAAGSAVAEVSRETLNELEIQQLRRDVSQLRTEQDFLRSELVAMRLDMNDMQAVRERVPVQQPAQYVRPESPQHSEAMLLAGRGISAAQIADHCGISVAEAELVCALARAEGGT